VVVRKQTRVLEVMTVRVSSSEENAKLLIITHEHLLDFPIIQESVSKKPTCRGPIFVLYVACHVFFLCCCTRNLTSMLFIKVPPKEIPKAVTNEMVKRFQSSASQILTKTGI